MAHPGTDMSARAKSTTMKQSLGGEVSLPQSGLAPSVSACRWCFLSPSHVLSLVSVQTIIIAPVMTGFVASFIKSVCLTGQLPRIASISVLLSVICRPRCWWPGWWSPYIARAVPVMDIFWWGLYLVGGRECMFIVLIGFIVQMHVFATVSKSVLPTLDENMLIMWCHLANLGWFCYFYQTRALHSIIDRVQIDLHSN